MRRIKSSIGIFLISFILGTEFIYGKGLQGAEPKQAVAYDEDINFPYISGYEDGTFKPERPVTREELATMLARIITKNRIPDEENRYDDLITGRFSTDAVNYITQLGIMKGVTAHTFKPADLVSVNEFNEVIERLAPYIKNMAVSLPRGEGDLTRVQVVITLNDLFNVQCNTCHTCTPFSDMKPGSPAYEAVLCATRPPVEEES